VPATNTTEYRPPRLDDHPGYDASRYALVPHVTAYGQVRRSEASTTERVVGRETRTAFAQFQLVNP